MSGEEEDQKKQSTEARGERKSEGEDWVVLDDKSITQPSSDSQSSKFQRRPTMAAGVDLTFSFEEGSPLRLLDEVHFVCATKLGEAELDVYSESLQECRTLKYCVGLRMDIDNSHTVETLLSSEWMNSLKRFQIGSTSRRPKPSPKKARADPSDTLSVSPTGRIERAIIIIDGFNLTSATLWADPLGSAQAVLQNGLELSHALCGQNLRESFAVFPFVWPSEGALLFGEGTDDGYKTAMSVQVLSHSLTELIQRLEYYFDSVDIVANSTGCLLALTSLAELQRMNSDGRGVEADETEVYGGSLDSPKSVDTSSTITSAATTATASASSAASSESSPVSSKVAEMTARSVVRKLVLIAAEMPRSVLKDSLLRIDRNIEVTAYVNTWDMRLAALTWIRWSEDRAGHSLEIISDNGRRLSVVDVTDIIFDWQRTGHYYATHPLVLSDLRNLILEDKPPDIRWDLTKQKYLVPVSDRTYDYYVLSGSEKYIA